MVLSCGVAHYDGWYGGSREDGESLGDSVQKVKDDVSGALQDGLNLGHGRSPLNPRYRLNVGY